MTTRARIVTVCFLILTALLLLGFWVGAFEAFGGYVTRRQAFGQTFYVGTTDAGDFVHTLFLALNNRL